MKTKEYQERFYRDRVSKQGLHFCEISVEETDLLISSDQKIPPPIIEAEIIRYRKQIKDYIAKDKNFLTSLKPVKINKDADAIIIDMAEAARIVGVGPMAAVAGAIGQYLGEGVFKDCKDLIIENGGDIFIKTTKSRNIGIYAGDSVLSGKIAIEIKPEHSPCGVCCSSGTVGHSLSFGKADAAVIVAKDTILADALATEIGNRVKTKNDLEEAINFGKGIIGIRGILIIIGESLSIWGEIRLV